MTRELTNEFIAPDFAGFYDSIFTPEHYEDVDDLTSDKDLQQWVCDNITYDYKEYETSVAKEYINVLECELKEFLPSFKAEYKEVDSPQYYNFETDKVVGLCNLEDIREEIKAYINKYPNEFKKWIKDKHSSYDGFISFYSNDVNDWDLDGDLDHNELGSIFGFILTNEKVIGYDCDYDLNNIVYEHGIYADWFIDTDKINKDFNFNAPVECLDDLQYFHKNDDGVYEWTKDVEGQLKLAL
jgi:hypothetical protein